jgi:hypothetical protein
VPQRTASSDVPRLSAYNISVFHERARAGVLSSECLRLCAGIKLLAAHLSALRVRDAGDEDSVFLHEQVW